MDIEELRPVFDLMGQMEERIVEKINDVHGSVKLQNSRIRKLETKEDLRCAGEKNKFWKTCAMVLVSALGAALIIQYGILEFLKLIK
jgi:hypothetical protein